MGACPRPSRPPFEPLFNDVHVSGGGRYEESVLGKPGDGAVVHDGAVVGTKQTVADSADGKIREVVGVNPVQQSASALPNNLQLSQCCHIDNAHPLPYRQAFILRRTVAMGSLPWAEIDHGGTQVSVVLVHGRALDRHVGRSSQSS